MTTYSTNTTLPSKGAQAEKITQTVQAQSKTIEFRIMAVVLAALTLWGSAIAVFGYPALIIVALTLVPIVFFCLLMITVGK